MPRQPTPQSRATSLFPEDFPFAQFSPGGVWPVLRRLGSSTSYRFSHFETGREPEFAQTPGICGRYWFSQNRWDIRIH